MRPCAARAIAFLLLAASGSLPPPARAALPVGFSETVLADSINSPVSMAIAADGRVFVCEQGGALRVIRRGVLLPRPAFVVPAVAAQEEGLLGVAVDPKFASNGHLYVVYAAASPQRHNRIARYTLRGDTASANSAVTLFELDDNGSHQHLGGAIHFGRDGKLYVGTGDNDEGSRAQSLRSTFGKLLRLNADGSIPSDNPFYRIASGKYRAIWAQGLRNVFSLDVQPGSGRLFINDVGGSSFKEVNQGAAGANYGWPIFEGPSRHDEFRFPVYSYDHSRGCAITGGAFYNPRSSAFPAAWIGRYFFAEYCASEIRWIGPAAPDSFTVFGTTRVAGPVNLRVGPDGNLYYLSRGNSAVTGGANSSSGMLVRISATPTTTRKR